MQQIDPKLVTVIAKALESSLAPVMLEPIQDSNAEAWLNDKLVSIVGFKSDEFSGTLILGCEIPFLESSCPCISKDTTPAEITEYINDWIGELSNLVMGRFKNFLAVYEIDFQINPPSIMPGTESIFERYSERHDSARAWFESEDGDRISILLTCEQQGFRLQQTGRANEQVQLAAGSGVLNLKSFDASEKNSSIMQSEGKLARAYYESCELTDLSEVDESFEDSLVEERVGGVVDDSDSNAIEEILNVEIEPAVNAVPSKDDTALRTLGRPQKGLTPSDQGLLNVAITDGRFVSIEFTSEVVFVLDPEALYRAGNRKFSIQNKPFEVDRRGQLYTLQFDGVTIQLEVKTEAA